MSETAFIRMSESTSAVDSSSVQIVNDDTVDQSERDKRMSSSNSHNGSLSGQNRNNGDNRLLDDDELTAQHMQAQAEEEESRSVHSDDAGEVTTTRPNSGSDRAASRQSDRSTARRRVQDEEEDEDEEMMYGAQHVIKLFVPVSLCMLVVVLTVASVNYYTDQSGGVYLIYTPFHPEAGDSTAETVKDTILNALIVLAVIVVMTTVLVLLYKYKFYKVIYGWLIFSSLILLFVFSFIYLEAVFKAYNVPFDLLTLSIFIWNFGCMGMLAMHWKAPLRVLQGYHIIISALLALVFIKYLPEWTLWTVLGVIALWDLVAVLCPHGPLRMLVNIAHERNENIFPSLIYTSTVAYIIGMADGTVPQTTDSEEGTSPSHRLSNSQRSSDNQTNDANSAACSSEAGPDRPLRDSSAWRESYGSGEEGTRPSARRRRHSDTEQEPGEDGDSAPSRRERDSQRPPQQQEDEDEEKGVKLGLGDFIFYSILVGKAASSGDWATTIAAYISILMGLFFTLVILAIRKTALPALPISIAFGLVFNFGTQYVISPFVSSLAAHQIFI